MPSAGHFVGQAALGMGNLPRGSHGFLGVPENPTKFIYSISNDLFFGNNISSSLNKSNVFDDE